MALNYPTTSSSSTVYPYKNEYVIGVKNVETIMLPIGSRPYVSWNAETETLQFFMANNSAGLEELAPYGADIGIVSENIEEVQALAGFVTDERIIFVGKEFLGIQGQVDFEFPYNDTMLKMEVFYNGRLLSEDDFYIHDNTTVTLNQPIDVDNDLVYIKAWNRIKIYDTMSESEVVPLVEEQIDTDVGTIGDFENNL